MIIYDEDFDVYHKNEAISSTEAKLALTGAQKFYDKREGLIARRDSGAMKFGRVVHAYFWEPGKYHENVVVKPHPMDGRSAAGKKWKAENEGKTVITPNEEQALHGLDARKPAAVSELLRDTSLESEVTVRAGGCQCRFDLVGIDFVTARPYDLKTTSNFDRFDQDVAKYYYEFSAGWYNMVWQMEGGEPIDCWTWIVAETEPPYRWDLVTLPSYLLRACTEVARNTLAAIQAHKPGSVPSCSPREWSPPPWSCIGGLS